MSGGTRVGSGAPREERGAPPPPVGQGGRVVLFACGNALRGDDSVAGRALAGLPDEVLRRAEVRSTAALEPEQLVDLDAGLAVLVIDAVAGVPAGQLVRLDLEAVADRAADVRACSTHQLPLDRVLGLASLLRDAPVRGLFLGLGVGDVGAGTRLSGPVAAAMPGLREAIAVAVEELAGPSQPASR